MSENMELRRGDRVAVTYRGQVYEGEVLTAANYGSENDPYWYIEMRYATHGYMYLKQKQDGASAVRKLPPLGLTVRVTQELIAAHLHNAGNCYRCPIAYALREALGLPSADEDERIVDVMFTYVWVRGVKYELPQAAETWQREAILPDAAPQPIEFVINGLFAREDDDAD